MFSDVEILGIIPEMKNPTKNEIIEQCNTLVQEQDGPRLVKKKLPPKQ